MQGKFKSFKLIGDAAYPMRPFFIVPFKGQKSGFPRKKQYWNFIQSSTRMAVERAFGILKGRRRILLKRLDMPLPNVLDVISACICLHNLCIIHGDGFDMQWAKKAELDLRRTQSCVLGDLRNTDMFHIAQESIKQMKMLQKPKIRIEHVDDDRSDYGWSGDEMEGPSRTKKEKEEKIKKMLLESTQFHESMARSFYEAKLEMDGGLIRKFRRRL